VFLIVCFRGVKDSANSELTKVELLKSYCLPSYSKWR